MEVGGSLSTHCSCADGDPAGGGGWQAYRGSGEAEGKRGGVGIRPFLSSSQETHRGQWHHFCGGLVHSVVVDSVTPWTLSMAQSPEGFSRPLCPWDFPARILECVAIPLSRGSSHPGIKPMSLALQADLLLSEPTEMPRFILLYFWGYFLLSTHGF